MFNFGMRSSVVSQVSGGAPIGAYPGYKLHIMCVEAGTFPLKYHSGACMRMGAYQGVGACPEHQMALTTTCSYSFQGAFSR